MQTKTDLPVIVQCNLREQELDTIIVSMVFLNIARNNPEAYADFSLRLSPEDRAGMLRALQLQVINEAAHAAMGHSESLCAGLNRQLTTLAKAAGWLG